MNIATNGTTNGTNEMIMKHLHGFSALAALAVLWTLGAGPAWADEFILKDGKWVTAPKPAKGTVEGELAMIRQQIDEKNFKSARAAADLFCKDHPDSPSCEEAMLLGSQAELDNGMYYQAFERLEAMLAKYPNGLFLERALTREMEVANAFLAGKKRIVGRMLRLPAADEGLTILRKIAEHAPGTDIAERAMLRIGEYHFEKKDYRDAADAYDEFLTMNPKSARAPHTMAQAAQAMYESFKGVPYDETPLVEAEARYKTLLAQYPDEARKCRAADMLREIVTIRGERAYETAKFYERTGRPQSAIFYYRQVAEEFPSTVWASEARTKVGVVPRQPSTKPAAAEIKPAAAPRGQAEVKFGQAKPGEQPVVVPANPPQPAKPVSVPEGGTLELGGSIPVAAPETKPATAPAVQPASQPATQPAAQITPVATAPQQGPQGPAGPVDLEKLANQSSKGQSK